MTTVGRFALCRRKNHALRTVWDNVQRLLRGELTPDLSPDELERLQREIGDSLNMMLLECSVLLNTIRKGLEDENKKPTAQPDGSTQARTQTEGEEGMEGRPGPHPIDTLER